MLPRPRAAAPLAPAHRALGPETATTLEELELEEAKAEQAAAGLSTAVPADTGLRAALAVSSVADVGPISEGASEEDPTDAAGLATQTAAVAALTQANAKNDAAPLVEALADGSSSSPSSSSSDSHDVDNDDSKAAALSALLSSEVGSAVSGILKVSVQQALQERRTHEDVVDEVRLGAAGWKERYYTAKFGAAAVADPAFLPRVFRAYVAGLVWVFRYYYQGVASWRWFYPYHYAPFASDLRGLREMGPITFDAGRPFRPLDQLMGVLPARSAHALPAACKALMTEPSSPVLDFYPAKFDSVSNPCGRRGGEGGGSRFGRGTVLAAMRHCLVR